MHMTGTNMLPDCTNCVHEYNCDWKKPKPCAEWRPDLDYKRMMEESMEEQNAGINTPKEQRD